MEKYVYSENENEEIEKILCMVYVQWSLEVTAGANNTLIVLCLSFGSPRFEDFLFRNQSSSSRSVILNRNRQQFSIVFTVIDNQRARNRSVIVKKNNYYFITLAKGSCNKTVISLGFVCFAGSAGSAVCSSTY